MTGPLEFREMLRDHEDTKREYRELNAKYEALQSKCAKMREVLGECRDELDDRYDGAPDSVTRWAGHLVAKIDAILESEE